MRIAIANTVLSNTGDAAIFAAISDSLVKAHVATPESITALDSAASTTRGLYPDWRIVQQLSRSGSHSRRRRRIFNLLRSLLTRAAVRSRAVRAILMSAPLSRSSAGEYVRTISQADLIVSSGGTYLVDHYNFGHRALELQLAAAMGKPIFLWTQSMGPFQTARASADIKKIAAVTDGAYFRDERSSDAWKHTIGELPPASATLPDSVFSLELRANREEKQGKLALLSVREWSQAVEGGELKYSSYVEGMRRIAENLTRSGWRCVAISTCQGVPGYSVDDSATARSIFKGLTVDIDAGFHTPASLAKIIATADLVIATRMHFAILSLLSQTPVVAIAYETKTLDLFSGLGHEQAVTAIEEIDANWADAVTAGVEEDRNFAAVLTREDLDALRMSARQPATAIARTLNLQDA